MLSTKTIASAVIVIFVLFFVINSPTDAANIVHSLGHGLGHVATQLTSFIKSLSS